MREIDADGTPIRVEVEGPTNAPAVIFSNSIGTDLTMWDDQAKALAGRFRVVRYDARGHGGSGVPAGPYSIERLGRDALAVLNALGIAKAHWCGLSMGGATGMWLARHAPERFDRLVLCNTAARIGSSDRWNERIRTVLSDGMNAVADTVLAIWFSKDFRARAPQVIERMRTMLVGISPQGYGGCAAALRDMDQRWGIADIALPTLIIGGKQDPATTIAEAEFMASRIKGAKLVQLDAAHLSNIEQSAAFTEAVEKFLGKR